MKRFLTSALVLALSVGAVQAQSDTAHHKGGKHRDKAQHEMGYKNANLTPDQQAKIKAINEAHRDAIKNLKAQTGLTDAERKSRMQAIQQQHKDALAAVLTAEQKAKVKDAHKDWKTDRQDREVRKGDGARKGNAKHGNERNTTMAKELNLTTEQQAKIEAIRRETKNKMDAVRNDATLTQEQKKAKAGEIMKAQQVQMKSILTTEQVQQMERGRKGNNSGRKK